MASKTKSKQSSRSVRKCAEVSRIFLREEVKAQYRKISEILKKSEEERNTEEENLLEQSQDVVKDIDKRAKVRELTKQRKLEIEDPHNVLRSKCCELANAIQDARSLVVYTGAGISTAASIPDYRGPNGVWTLLQQGIQPRGQDLSDSEPTYTHQSLAALHQNGLLKYVVSQNCDGLHLRSGLDRMALAELHGNMFIEVCVECSPPIEYVRLFDVTERTGLRKHKTGRCCTKCHGELRDTIVHFGEKGDTRPPHNWNEAAKYVDTADVLLCLGSSLKVLKKYPCLWHNHKPISSRAKLYIVNLQWTPKDDSAVLKINGRCDDVMQLVMEQLGLDIPPYTKLSDPLFYLYTPLLKSEYDTMHKKLLEKPPDYNLLEQEQRFGPRCNTFPCYTHTSDIQLKSKQWKAKKLKVFKPVSKPWKHMKEICEKDITDETVLTGVPCSDSNVKSPKIEQDESVTKSGVLVNINASKKRKNPEYMTKGSVRVTRARLQDKPVDVDIDNPAKCSLKSAGKFQMDYYDVFDFEPKGFSEGLSSEGLSSEGLSSPELETKLGSKCLKKGLELKHDDVIKSEEVNEFVLAGKDKPVDLKDLINVSLFNEKIKVEDIKDSNQFLDGVMDHADSCEKSSIIIGGLETATDGTVALSKESEDNQTESPQKAYSTSYFSHSSVPTQNDSPLKHSGSAMLCGSSFDDVGQDLNQPETSTSSKYIGEMSSLDNDSTLPRSVVSPLSLIQADANCLPHRTEVSTSEPDPDDPDCGSFSLRQLYSKTYSKQDNNLKDSDTEALDDPFGMYYSSQGSNENLHLLSMVSADSQVTKHSESDPCIPETSTPSAAIINHNNLRAKKAATTVNCQEKELLTTAGSTVHLATTAGSVVHLATTAGSTVHLATTAGSAVHLATTAGSVVHLATTAGSTVHLATTAGSAVDIPQLRKPSIPWIPKVQSAILSPPTASSLVNTSDSTMTSTFTKTAQVAMATTKAHVAMVTTTSQVAMVTMTVSDYLASVATKRSSVASTTTTNSHQHSPRYIVQGTNQNKISQLQVSANQDSVNTNLTSHTQLMSPVMGVSPGMVLFPATMLAYPPPAYTRPGYPHHAMLATAPMSYVQTAVPSTTTKTGMAIVPSTPTKTGMATVPSTPTKTDMATVPSAPTKTDMATVPSTPTKTGMVHKTTVTHMQLPVQLPPQHYMESAKSVSSTTLPITTSVTTAVLSTPVHMPVSIASNPIVCQKETSPKKKKSNRKKEKQLAAHQSQAGTTPSLLSPVLHITEQQKSSGKKKSQSSPQAPVSTASTPSNKAPFGPPDPHTYKYLSECLMRNIQLITGLPVATPAVTQTSPQTTAQSAMAQVMNTIARTVTASSWLENPTPPAKTKSKKKQKSFQQSSSHSQTVPSTTAPVSIPVVTNEHVRAQSIDKLTGDIQCMNQQSSVAGNVPVLQDGSSQPLPVPPPAHQGVGPPQQAIGEPSPAHQASAQRMPPPTAHQISTTNPAHMAAFQQMIALQNMGRNHSIISQMSGKGEVPQLVPAAYYGAMTQSSAQVVTTSAKQSAQSTISCPNIVAALGKPPQQSMWPMMMVAPPDGKVTMTSVTDDQRRAAEHTANQIIACSQSQHSKGAPQNQEALKKSIHIQNILTHLRKATPGAPLPPYMFDNKTSTDNSTVNYSVSQEPVTLPHQWDQMTTSTTTSVPHVHHNAQHHPGQEMVKPAVTKSDICASTDLKNQEFVSVAAIQQTIGKMSSQYAISPGALTWHQPNTVTAGGGNHEAVPLAGSHPTALSDQSAAHSVASESSLSNSGSFDGLHKQLPPQETSILPSQLDSQMSESGDTDICYETYLIDTSATGGDGAEALQQAQAAVFQQLAYSATDPTDRNQTVVVMDTQGVAFLDDIECEIEIEESLPEPSEGIEAGEMTSESTSTTPSAITNTGPSVYTEVVQQHPTEDGQIGQLGMQLSGEVDLMISPGTPMWDSQPGQLTPRNLGQTASPKLGQIPQKPKEAEDEALTAPGWFGKGLGIKKTKRKRSK